MSFIRTIWIAFGYFLGAVAGLGLVYWARTILRDYKREFLSQPALRMLQDITMAALFDGHTIAAGGAALGIIGWGLIIGGLLGAAYVLLYGLFEWSCSWSAWVRTWWDGACVTLFHPGA
jgi:hypothetical protein